MTNNLITKTNVVRKTKIRSFEYDQYRDGKNTAGAICGRW